ncbi:hypothetical protein H7Y21_02015 [Arenimonas sp.]|nr:hypothetical protein [Candidatus Parcubacteria bacterium]
MKTPFILVVDAYPLAFLNNDVEEILVGLGLVLGETCRVVAPQDAEATLWQQSELLGSENLLIFMSTFYGSIEPAVALSQKIKAANPCAHIVLRSNMRLEERYKSLFSRAIKKGNVIEGEDPLVEIIREFMASIQATK